MEAVILSIKLYPIPLYMEKHLLSYPLKSLPGEVSFGYPRLVGGNHDPIAKFFDSSYSFRNPWENLHLIRAEGGVHYAMLLVIYQLVYHPVPVEEYCPGTGDWGLEIGDWRLGVRVWHLSSSEMKLVR